MTGQIVTDLRSPLFFFLFFIITIRVLIQRSLLCSAHCSIHTQNLEKFNHLKCFMDFKYDGIMHFTLEGSVHHGCIYLIKHRIKIVNIKIL